MRMIRGAVAALALVAVAACGSSTKSSPSSGTEAVNQTFTGTLSDGSLVTLEFGAATAALRSTALRPVPRASTASALVQVTGTVKRIDGAVVALTGTYDPATRQFSIGGGDYTFSGTYEGGAIQAQATVGGTPVALVAFMGAPATVAQYCGTFTNANRETGSFNLVVSGGKAFGVAQGGITFSGTVSGAAITMKDGRGNPIRAVVDGSTVSGTFTTSSGQGTFDGSAAACAAILDTPPTCATFTYAAWGACQASNTQSRTVASAAPAGCKGGAPVLVQACTYVPPEPVACTYTYSDWAACQVNGTQSRNVVTALPDGCKGTPALTQACTYVPPPPDACTYTYSDWSACHPDGTQDRKVNTATPEGCTGTPVLTQACDYVPPACTYTYSDWGACQPDGTQARTVTSAAPAGCAGTPDLTQACTYVPPSACEPPATNPAPDIYTTLSKTLTAPAAAGGKLLDGTYHRTVVTKFGQDVDGTDKSGGTRKLQVTIAGGELDVVETSGGVTSRMTGTIAVDEQAKTFTMTVTCSAVPEEVGQAITLGYTATATGLKVYDTVENTEEVFALQGVEPPPPLECPAPQANPAGASQDKDSTSLAGPPPAGGVVGDGTYDLWMSVYYGQSSSGTTTSVDRRRLVISGGSIDVTTSDDTSIDRFLGTIAVDEAAKRLTVTLTCTTDPVNMPVGSQMVFDYTVDTGSMPGSTLLKLYSSSRTGLPKEESYKLQ